MADEEQYLNDGNITFSGGQDDGSPPDTLGGDQYRRGINVTTNKGHLGPRPGFIHKEYEIITPGGIARRSYSAIDRTGKFQMAAAYDADNGQFIIAVKSGIIFRINPRKLQAEVLSLPDGDRLSQFRRRIPWTYSGKFLVLFDWPNKPVIIENNTVRRARPGDPFWEVPTSVLGTTVNNRTFVANILNEFLAGDPIGGINGDAPITFEELFAPAAPYLGQTFSLGSQSTNQPITAMGFLQVPDTSTGVGPLIVATKNAVHAFRADLPRTEWEASSFGRIILYNAGIAGPRAFVNQNSDLFFQGGDNQLRSLLMGRAEQERWSNTPISNEVSPWLDDFQNEELLDIAIVAADRKRVYFGVAPYKTQALDLIGRPIYDCAHAGMVVLELRNVSGLKKQATPAWAGLWTGISPMEFVSLNEGTYIFSKDDGGVNRLYFMDETKTYDEFEGEPKDIVSRIYLREYSCQADFQDKTLGNVDYSLSNIAGDFKLRAEYKPGHSEAWNLWKNFEHEAITEKETNDAQVMPTLSTQSFRELDFGDPEEVECDPLTGEHTNILRKLGLRLTIKARNWTLNSLRVRLRLEPQTGRPSTPRCDKISKEVALEDELSDWELYRTATQDAEWPSPAQII